MGALYDLLRDRRLWSGAFPWTIGLLVIMNMAIRFNHGDLEAQRKGNLLALAPKENARYDASLGERLEDYFGKIPNAQAQPLVILTGMSQLFSINEEKPGDQTTAEWLDDALAPKGVRVFGLAAPNLTNEEALFYLLATASTPEAHPAAFIYAICFDKMRNVELRSGLKRFLQSRPALKDMWADACRGRADRYPIACEQMKATLASLKEPEEKANASASETFEGDARATAARLVPMVADRQNLNSLVQLNIYFLRNKIFNIKTTSKRPIIPSRYELNQQFIQLLVELAQEKNVKLFFYVIPINPLSETPYIPEEYAAFKKWVEDLARERGVPFANFEKVVPSEDWGHWAHYTEPDFKHYTGAGHRKTAEALMSTFGPELRALAHDPGAREAHAP
jgi:hypothetical protein